MPSPMQTRVAGSREVGVFTPVQLFAGDFPINTQPGTTAVALLEYQVVALVNDLYVPHNPAGTDGSEVAAGINLYAVNGTTQTAVEIYDSGHFNHEALVWDATLTTFESRKAVFQNLQTVKIGKLVNF